MHTQEVTEELGVSLNYLQVVLREEFGMKPTDVFVRKPKEDRGGLIREVPWEAMLDSEVAEEYGLREDYVRALRRRAGAGRPEGMPKHAKTYESMSGCVAFHEWHRRRNHYYRNEFVLGDYVEYRADGGLKNPKKLPDGWIKNGWIEPITRRARGGHATLWRFTKKFRQKAELMGFRVYDPRKDEWD